MAVLCVLAAVVAHRQAAAQLMSARSLLDSPFYTTGNPLGMQPRLLGTFQDPLDRSGDFLGTGLSAGETVRTVQAAKHVGDLYGDGHSFLASIGERHPFAAQFYWEGGAQHGVFVDTAQKRTTAQMRDSEWAARLRYKVGHSEAYVGYDAATESTEVRSDLLTDTLPLFTETPQARWQWARQNTVMGLVLPCTSRFTLEATGGYVQSPGSLSLAGSAARVLVPLDNAGMAWSLALQARADRRTQFIGFARQMDLAGSNSARRDGTLLGSTRTTFSESAWGVVVQRAFGGSGQASLSWATASWNMDSHAYGLSPAPLGFSTGQVDRVGYYLFGTMRRREYGAQWTQHFARHHLLQFEYRWIEAPFRLEAGYTAATFLNGAAQGIVLSLPNARAHLLRIRYMFPIHSAAVIFELSQIIPMPEAHKPSVSPIPGSSPRRSSGGWNAFFTLRRYL